MPRRPKDDPAAPELDRASIVRAALEMIDGGGLVDFSLRAVARRLGAGNMSIYHYVRDRDELLALVLDEVLGTISLHRLPREPLEAVAVLSKRFVRAFRAHPEAIPLFVLQPVMTIGPHGAALFDRFVGLLRSTGLPDQRVAEVTVVLIDDLCGHLIGHLLQVRHRAETDEAIVDEVLAQLPDDLAPNIRALAPALRRAAHSSAVAPGVVMILAAVTAEVDARG